MNAVIYLGFGNHYFWLALTYQVLSVLLIYLLMFLEKKLSRYLSELLVHYQAQLSIFFTFKFFEFITVNAIYEEIRLLQTPIFFTIYSKYQIYPFI